MWIWIWGDQRSSRHGPKNASRHRGEEKSVHHRGSPFLLLIGNERSNEVTSLEFFWKKSPPVYVPVNSLSSRGAHKPSLWNRMCGCMERPIKAAVATSLIPGVGSTTAYMYRLCPGPAPAELTDGAKPSQALPAELVQAVSTLRSTLFWFSKGTVRAQNLFPFVSY